MPPWLILLLMVTVVEEGQSATFGTWKCTMGGSRGKVVSRGDFTISTFMPFLSPFTSEGECPEQRYLGDLTCEYDVVAPTGHVIYGEFISFTLDADCKSDFVRVQQLDQPTKKIPFFDETYCTQNSGQYFTVAGERLLMTFTTDTHHSCKGFSGFFSAYKPFGAWTSSTKSYSTSGSRTKTSLDLSNSYRHDNRFFLYLFRARVRLIERQKRYCEAVNAACKGYLGVVVTCSTQSCQDIGGNQPLILISVPPQRRPVRRTSRRRRRHTSWTSRRSWRRRPRRSTNCECRAFL